MSPITNHQSPITSFPSSRPRRLRQAGWLRELVAETRLHPSDLIWPVFVVEGTGEIQPIATMPGVSRMSIDVLVAEVKKAAALGIPAIALFPVVDASKKDILGSEALNENNLACRAIKTLKDNIPHMGIIADIALDPYTSHGQDGIVENGMVLNDKTVEQLAKQSLVCARAGADIVAPSDMMDGRVGAIRQMLENHGNHNTLILSYAAKYASCMYGPFRDAVGSAGALGNADKTTYQMHPANACEAMKEIAMDIAEGADMVMVKPGLPYLDIIHRAATSFNVPVLAYQVSGEYAAIKFASQHNALNDKAAFLEQTLSLKRAGARAILTYAAHDIAGWL